MGLSGVNAMHPAGMDLRGHNTLRIRFLIPGTVYNVTDITPKA